MAIRTGLVVVLVVACAISASADRLRGARNLLQEIGDGPFQVDVYIGSTTCQGTPTTLDVYLGQCLNFTLVGITVFTRITCLPDGVANVPIATDSCASLDTAQTINATTGCNVAPNNLPVSVFVKLNPCAGASITTPGPDVTFVPVPTAEPAETADHTPAPDKYLCDAAVDVQWVLDGSGSIQWQFPIELDFVQQVSAEFKVGLEAAHVGVLQFRGEAKVPSPEFPPVRVEIPLTGDPASLDSVRSIKQLTKGWTRTDLALQAANASLTGLAAREGVPKVIVLCTDGLPEDGYLTPPCRQSFWCTTVFQWAVSNSTALQAAGIKVVVIGVGPTAQPLRLQALASGGAQNVFYGDNFRALLSPALITEIVAAICPATGGTTPAPVVSPGPAESPDVTLPPQLPVPVETPVPAETAPPGGDVTPPPPPPPPLVPVETPVPAETAAPGGGPYEVDVYIGSTDCTSSSPTTLQVNLGQCESFTLSGITVYVRASCAMTGTQVLISTNSCAALDTAQPLNVKAGCNAGPNGLPLSVNIPVDPCAG